MRSIERIIERACWRIYGACWRMPTQGWRYDPANACMHALERIAGLRGWGERMQ